MAGALTNFLVAFIVILGVTLSTKHTYLLNRNAKFGMKCSGTAKEVGFKDGDKVLLVNNQEVELFNDILPTIILTYGEAKVTVERAGKQEIVTINDQDKLKLMKETRHFFPILKPDSIKDPTANYLTYNERPKGLKDAFEGFGAIASIPFHLFKTRNGQVGGFITLSYPHDIRGYLLAFAMVSISIGWINLLPLPGLDAGNTIIAIAEQKRRKKVDPQKIRKMRIIFSTFFILLLLVLVIYNLSYLF
jgi:regulator of sigma E protease